MRSTISQASTPLPRYALWLVPSLADIIFVIALGALLYVPVSVSLLEDADTGWHIRNGEHILLTHHVPRHDYFSYTKLGNPWYAWEWLYDVVIGAIHTVAGLNGVVLFTAIILALTFALLFRFLLWRCGNVAIAAILTLLSFKVAELHMLARPHVLTWLLLVVWTRLLYQYLEGKRTALLWLPPLMALWANLHGGFLLGLVLIALFLIESVWHLLNTECGAERHQKRKSIRDLGGALVGCLLASLATPYGYNLHVHIFHFLSNTYLMNKIEEFRSPDFHTAAAKAFLGLILLAIVACTLAGRQLRSRDLLLFLFATTSGLYAARNVPTSALLIAAAIAPALSVIMSADEQRPKWLQAFFDFVNDVSANATSIDSACRGHLLATIVVALTIMLALNHGRIFSMQLMSAHFNENLFPVKATEVIAAKGITQGVFSTDDWSGYLIYRLHPQLKMFFDDRYDFYGEQFIREYTRTAEGRADWQKALDEYKVNWVLISTERPLSNVLRESADWRKEYQDKVAILFARVKPK